MKRLAISLFLFACSPTPGVESTDLTSGSARLVNATELLHTRPECAHEGKPATWCTYEDVGSTATLSGMEQRIIELIGRAQDPATAHIALGYFSFSNRGVFAALCEKGQAGFVIDGFFDQAYRDGLPGRLANECQGPSGNNVNIRFLGQKTEQPWVWRLHHNKFMMIDPGDGSDVSLGFSSGNLSVFGISVHFDHWVVLHASADTRLVSMHRCLTDALSTAVEGREVDDPELYRDTLDECLADLDVDTQGQWIEPALADERVAPLFSPDPSGRTARTLIKQINRVHSGGSIDLAMQHFLHYGIANALVDAAERGVAVRLIMDDDVVTGEGEVPGTAEFYQNVLHPEESGFDVRFLVTNAPEFQMMHNKFAIMRGIDGNKTRVFSGAGHFTTAALRDNYENFYLTQIPSLTAQYEELFAYMWPRTLSEAEVPPPAQE